MGFNHHGTQSAVFEIPIKGTINNGNVRNGAIRNPGLGTVDFKIVTPVLDTCLNRSKIDPALGSENRYSQFSLNQVANVLSFAQSFPIP
jgi:hypothetical protein